MSKGPKGQDSTQDLRQDTPESPERKEKEQVASLCIAVHLKYWNCSKAATVRSVNKKVNSNVSCVSYKLRPAAGPHRNTFGALEPPPHLSSASPGITPPPPSSPQGASGGSSSLQTSVSGDQTGRPCYVCKLCQFLDCKYTFKSFKFVYCSLQITWIGFERWSALSSRPSTNVCSLPLVTTDQPEQVRHPSLELQLNQGPTSTPLISI